MVRSPHSRERRVAASQAPSRSPHPQRGSCPARRPGRSPSSRRRSRLPAQARGPGAINVRILRFSLSSEGQGLGQLPLVSQQPLEARASSPSYGCSRACRPPGRREGGALAEAVARAAGARPSLGADRLQPGFPSRSPMQNVPAERGHALGACSRPRLGGSRTPRGRGRSRFRLPCTLRRTCSWVQTPLWHLSVSQQRRRGESSHRAGAVRTPSSRLRSRPWGRSGRDSARSAAQQVPLPQQLSCLRQGDPLRQHLWVAVG